jgi:hypothetical protein
VEGKQILTAVKLAPSQRAKVERWAALTGSNLSTVLRSLIDAMDVRTETVFFVANPEAELVQRSQTIDTEQEVILA